VRPVSVGGGKAVVGAPGDHARRGLLAQRDTGGLGCAIRDLAHRGLVTLVYGRRLLGQQFGQTCTGGGGHRRFCSRGCVGRLQQRHGGNRFVHRGLHDGHDAGGRGRADAGRHDDIAGDGVPVGHAVGLRARRSGEEGGRDEDRRGGKGRSGFHVGPW
jgi:hypothetical protein